MPTTIYDSSLITQRRRDKTIAGSFINRIQNPINPTSGSAPLLGISEQSIINTVKNGQMTTYRKNDGGCTNIDTGCPCLPIPVSHPLYDFFQRGWATNISGNLISYGLTVDSSGNIYVTGVYDSTFIIINSFDYVSSGIINIIPFGKLDNSGGNKAFIVKYNTNGIVQWVTKVDGIGDTIYDEAGDGIAVDSSGNVYITWKYSPPFAAIYSFGSVSNGIIDTPLYGNLANSGTDNNNNTFIVKYNTNGIVQWATSIGGNDFGIGISVDSLGSVYITGAFNGSNITLFSFDYVSGETIRTEAYGELANSGSDDNTFIVKYNTNGMALWATSIGNNDSGKKIVTDSSGNVYVSGIYSASAIIIYSYSSGCQSGNQLITTLPYGTLPSTGGQEVFIVKYNTNGIAQWATYIDTFSIGTGTGIAVDSLGNVYVTGLYMTTPDGSAITINSYISGCKPSTDPITTAEYGKLNVRDETGNPDAFIIKYDTNGIAQWATSLGGAELDIGIRITTDSSNNVYVTGLYNIFSLTIYSYTSGCGPGPQLISTDAYGTLDNSGGLDAFIIKYNTNGIAQWVTSVGGAGSDVAGDEIGTGIAVDSYNNVYITGIYNSPTVIINSYTSGCGPGNNKINTRLYGALTKGGAQDVFIVKYNTDGQIV